MWQEICVIKWIWFNPMFPDEHFAYSTIKCMLYIYISLKFVPKVAVVNKSTLIQLMACHRTGNYLDQCWPSLLTHICTTREQWVKQSDTNHVFKSMRHAIEPVPFGTKPQYKPMLHWKKYVKSTTWYFSKGRKCWGHKTCRSKGCLNQWMDPLYYVQNDIDKKANVFISGTWFEIGRRYMNTAILSVIYSTCLPSKAFYCYTYFQCLNNRRFIPECTNVSK